VWSKQFLHGVQNTLALALLDIQLALRWVQQNGAKFGGDPRRVTLIGQSSGGTNILALLASPASNGLFAAAISLSASPNITIDQAREPFRQFSLDFS
jgi:para-nitrobenzyl esterase